MKPSAIEEARQTANRFLRTVDALEQRIRVDPYMATRIWMGCKETSAVRRASLDLTRSLAEMRKP